MILVTEVKWEKRSPKPGPVREVSHENAATALKVKTVAGRGVGRFLFLDSTLPLLEFKVRFARLAPQDKMNFWAL
jgi:hypothetical protein